MLRLTVPRTAPMSGPITDPRAARTCVNAGVGLLRGQLVTLKEVERGLAATEAEFTTAMKHKAVIDTTLLGLKWTRAACDAFITIASGFAGAPGTVIAGAYDVSSATAAATSSALAGQPADLVKEASKAAAGTLKGAAGLAKMNKLPLSAAAKTDLDQIRTAAGVGKINVNVVHSAIKQDAAGISRQVFYELSAEITTMSLEYLEKAKAVKVTKVGKALVDAGLSLYSSYDEFQKESAANEQSLRSMKQTIANQMASVRKRIRQIEEELATCGPPIRIT